MQAILKPAAHPEWGEIIIKDSLFAIGRHEPPFSNYQPEFVEKLSRRHARIFEQDGSIYIADLGSLNGTTVNGESVSTLPMRLGRGDEICFSGSLCYQIEIFGAAAARAQEPPGVPPMQLILHPQSQRSLLEPIVVTQFPFLINKASDVFARYRDSLPKEVSYLSRRHAHIFLKEGHLYIEDLGSTNGTFVSGLRLEEHARQLQNGDVLAFGGDSFVYRVELVYQQEEMTNDTLQGREPLTATAHGIEDVTRTTFVTSATSFLDIYCIDDEAGAADDREGQPAVDDAGQESPIENLAAAPGWRRLPRKTASMLKEFRGAFFEEGQGRPTKLWIAAAALAAVVALALFFINTPKREISELLEQKAYLDALAQANQYLRNNQGDREVSEQATEALLKATVPAWMDLVLAGEFREAQQELSDARTLSRFNPPGEQTLELMSWVTQLEQFIDERGGANAAVVMFEQERQIKQLLDWWDADTKAHRRSLAAISHHVPAFSELSTRVFSHVRKLESQRSLDIAAIERLVDTIEARLQAGDAASLDAVITDFEEKYPRIVGTEKLRADLQNYLVLDKEISSTNWIRAYRTALANDYQTQLFRERIALLNEEVLPPAEIVDRYDDALLAWQSGNLDTAMTVLESLSGQRWGEVADRRLERNRRLMREFEALKQMKGKAGYEDQLIAFYNTLDSEQDIYFVTAVQEEFQLHRKKALAEAQAAFKAARSAWEDYQDNGGIRGLHRLEARVSQTYRRMAKLLTEAYENVSRGVSTHQVLGEDYAAEWHALHVEIVNEVRLQRRSLTELAMVLEPSLKQAKLDLLPTLNSPDPAEAADHGEREGVNLYRTESSGGIHER